MHIVTTTTQFQGYSQNSAARAGYGEVQPGDIVTVSFEAYAKTAGQKACVGIH